MQHFKKITTIREPKRKKIPRLVKLRSIKGVKYNYVACKPYGAEFRKTE